MSDPRHRAGTGRVQRAGADRSSAARAGCETRHHRAHQGARRRTRGQPRRQLGRPRRARGAAAELRERKIAPLSRRLRAARLLDRRRAVVTRNPRAADDRGRLRAGREGDDRRLARLEDRAQRIDVLELADDRRFRAIRRARPGRLHRRALSDAGHARSRGLVGHSMGGYGATRIGMKHADVFGSLYIMSPCCLSARGVGRDPAELEKTLAEAGRRRIPQSCRSSRARNWLPHRRGRPTRRTRRSISICRSKDGTPGGRAGALGRQCPAGVRRSVHRRLAQLSRHRHGRRRPGWTPHGRRQASRRLRLLRPLEHIRDLRGHAHERGGRSLPEPRAAVLQSHVVCREGLSIDRLTDAQGLFHDGSVHRRVTTDGVAAARAQRRAGDARSLDRGHRERQVLRVRNRARPAHLGVRRWVDVATGRERSCRHCPADARARKSLRAAATTPGRLT